MEDLKPQILYKDTRKTSSEGSLKGAVHNRKNATHYEVGVN